MIDNHDLHLALDTLDELIQTSNEESHLQSHMDSSDTQPDLNHGSLVDFVVQTYHLNHVHGTDDDHRGCIKHVELPVIASRV